MALAIRPLTGLTFPFEEHVDRGHSYTQQYTWGDVAAQAVYVIDVPWSTYVSGQAVREILGITRLIRSGSLATLQRTVPMRHPYFKFSSGNLFAAKITAVEGIRHNGLDTANAIATYERARLHIMFQQLPYRVLTDAQLAAQPDTREYNRWTHIASNPSGDYIVRERGAWKWVNGDQAGKEFNPGTPQLLAKKRIKLTWYNVPAGGLFGTSYQGRAANQEDGIGRVNDAAFFGHPAETLLLVDVEYRERYSWMEAPALGLADSTFPALCYDVIFDIAHFDPISVDPGLAKGHNLMPQPKNQSWALITDNAGNRLYRPYDYRSLFNPQ